MKISKINKKFKVVSQDDEEKDDFVFEFKNVKRKDKYEIVFRDFGFSSERYQANRIATWNEINQYGKPFEIIKKSIFDEDETLILEYGYLISLDCNDFIQSFDEIDEENHPKEHSLFLNIDYEDNHGLSYVPDIPILTFLQDLFLACALTRPGALSMIPMKIINTQNDDLQITPLYSCIIEQAYEYCYSWGWPSFKNNTFSETWEWLDKIGFLNSAVATSPPTKACSSIIELSGSDWLGPSEILTVSIVLESLLTDNKYGLSKQIRDRLNLIFGEPLKNKKWVTRFYEQRSKIIHGSANLPRPFAQVDFDMDVQELYADCYNTVSCGLGIIIALLKTLIKNQSEGFDFTENYNLLPFKEQ